MSAQKHKVKLLSKNQARKIISQGLEKVKLDKKRVLVLCPDCTRSGPMPLIFEILAEQLLPRVSKLDFLIALGTHQPMSRKAQNSLFGITEASHEKIFKDKHLQSRLAKPREPAKGGQGQRLGDGKNQQGHDQAGGHGRAQQDDF